MDTYVVQVWVPAEATTSETRLMRGLVRHVRSGASTAFVGPGELLDFIGDPGPTEAPTGSGPNGHSSRRASRGPLSLQERLSFGSDSDR